MKIGRPYLENLLRWINFSFTMCIYTITHAHSTHHIHSSSIFNFIYVSVRIYIDVLGNLDNKNIVYSFTLETKWSVTAGHSTFIRRAVACPVQILR